MNTAPTLGYAAVRPAAAIDNTAADQDPAWQEWQVIDRRDGSVIQECYPPQPHNLPDAVASINQPDCTICHGGFELIDLAVCQRCEGRGWLPSDPKTPTVPMGHYMRCPDCDGTGNVEHYAPCQRCEQFPLHAHGDDGPVQWLSPLGQAEALTAELNAYFSKPGPIPTTGDLCDYARGLRIQGVTL